MTRRPALVEEVLDDTMLVVWRSAPTATTAGSKVSTWIFAIAYRTALKALQRLDEAVDRRRGRGARLRRARPRAAPRRSSSCATLLLRALEALSAPTARGGRADLLPRHGYREIAEIVDCPVDTVKTRMFHARRRLRTLLGDSREEAL